MTYCFRCLDCEFRATTSDREGAFWNHHNSHRVVRDYRAESVGMAIGNLKKEREHSKEEYAAAFLPTNAELATAGDPDGKKAMREWRDTHSPRESNKTPYWPGEVEKTAF